MNFTTEDYIANTSFITSPPGELSLYYAAFEVLVAVFAVVGNAMVIFVFRKERRLRRRTNYYIVSLAAADLLVGLLGIPFAIMASVGLPSNLYACLFTVSLLVVLCTISIFCLVAVSVDRYWAILHPMGYSRNVRTRTALVPLRLNRQFYEYIAFSLSGWNSSRKLNGLTNAEAVSPQYYVASTRYIGVCRSSRRQLTSTTPFGYCVSLLLWDCQWTVDNPINFEDKHRFMWPLKEGMETKA
ncbi:hypothetical protein Trydic_g18132 [Trypoxylus dichotomus]